MMSDPSRARCRTSSSTRGSDTTSVERLDLHFERDTDGRTDYRVLDTRGTLHVIRQPSPWSLTAGVGERLRDVIESLLPGR
jgi:hypothetical protein